MMARRILDLDNCIGRMWNVPHGKIPLVMWQVESSKVHMKIACVATTKSDTLLIA